MRKLVFVALLASLLGLSPSIRAAYRVILSFTDNSTEICEAQDFVFDFTQIYINNVVSCNPDEIFKSDFEPHTNRPEPNK